MDTHQKVFELNSLLVAEGVTRYHAQWPYSKTPDGFDSVLKSTLQRAVWKELQFVLLEKKSEMTDPEINKLLSTALEMLGRRAVDQVLESWL